MSRRSIALTAVITATAVAGLAACGGDDDGGEAAPIAETGDPSDAAAVAGAVPYGPVDPVTAATLAENDSITVIDVRTPEEYAEGHLAGATLLDFYEPTFAEQLAELERDGTYLLYCRSGNRSGQAASIMADLGFEQVYDLQGGVVAYGSAGLPLDG